MNWKLANPPLFPNFPKLVFQSSTFPLVVFQVESQAVTETGLAQSISSAAEGVATWRQRLSQGRIWRDEEGANWPEATLRGGWQDLLREKGGEK